MQTDEILEAVAELLEEEGVEVYALAFISPEEEVRDLCNTNNVPIELSSEFADTLEDMSCSIRDDA